jgi:hypothetical protein
MAVEGSRSTLDSHVDIVRDATVISWTAVSDTHGSAVYLPVVLRSYGP